MKKKTAKRWLARNAWTLAKCRVDQSFTKDNWPTKVRKQFKACAKALKP